MNNDSHSCFGYTWPARDSKLTKGRLRISQKKDSIPLEVLLRLRVRGDGLFRRASFWLDWISCLKPPRSNLAQGCLDANQEIFMRSPRRLRLRTASSRTGRSLAIESGLAPDDHDSCNGPAK